MASTYVNDLRLNEMATGDGSGTWGTTTNTNLELIAEAFSYGTEAITTNADTHTTTIADGASDPGRALYLKYTGTLDSACTITIGPNTVSKVWIIENGTSGSQNIIISQGSGANITIPAGDTKVVYSDGAGAGAAFVDAFASLSVVDLKVQDDLTVTDAALVTGVLTTTATQVATGGITSGSDIISDTDSTDSLGSTGVRWLKGWFDTLTAGTLTVGSGSVTDSSGAISFGDENLTTTGIVTAAGTSVFTNLDISGDVDVDGTTNLDVVDIDGAVDMASTALVTGVLTANGGAVFNETGADVDFRVESDTVDHALFVQGSDGFVGIGTSSPVDLLHVKGTTSLVGDYQIVAEGGTGGYGAGISFQSPLTGGSLAEMARITADGEAAWDTTAANQDAGLRFYTALDGTVAERVRVTAAGNVGIGTASPTAPLDVFGNNAVARFNSVDANGNYILFASNAVAKAYIGNGNQIISGGSANDWGLRAENNLLFASGGGTERMRIDTSGNLLVGMTSSSYLAADSGVQLYGYGGARFGADGTAARNLISFVNGTDGTPAEVGLIQTNGSSTSYVTSSDQRLKENIADADDAGSKIDAIQVRKFDWKVDGSHQDYGMVAQELQAVAPEAVSVPEDPEKMMGVDYSKLVPMLVKEIQSLRTRITALES
jgi:hypothetical protein